MEAKLLKHSICQQTRDWGKPRESRQSKQPVFFLMRVYTFLGVNKLVRQPRLYIHCEILSLLTPTAVVINRCAASICQVCTRLWIKELFCTIIQANRVFKIGTLNWLQLYILTYIYIYTHVHIYVIDADKKVKVKESRYRPGDAQRVPGGLGSQIFMTFGTWTWWGRQPHAPAAFTPRNVPGTHFH
jgi:hypothetical protein